MPNSSRRPALSWRRISLVVSLLALQMGVVTSLPASADLAVVGEWSAPIDLGVIGVHSILLRSGKVLLFSYPVSAVGSDARLFDPATNTTTDVSINRQLDVFCSAHSLLADGRVFTTGGHVHLAPFGWGIKNTTMFDPATNAWTDGPLLTQERWYPTNVTLGNGKVLIFSGDISPRVGASTVDSYDPATNTITQLPTTASRYLSLYPKLHLLANGQILWDNTRQPMLFNPTANRWTRTAVTNFGSRWQSGASILLPGGNKVLIFGGSAKDSAPATNTAEIIDYSQPTPAWRFTASMSFARGWPNGLLLPDGTVLAVGGGTNGRYTNPVTTPEVFNPTTETWTSLAAQQYPRMYHSTAVLLPDGRVLSAGQDSNTSGQFTGEIYSPPYLFKGPRPTIASAPSSIGYGGQAFTVSTPDASSISRVALIRPGSITHSTDFDQRYVDLSFVDNGDGTLSVTGPSTGTQAPPGNYMLFLVNSNGVPSVASWVLVA